MSYVHMAEFDTENAVVSVAMTPAAKASRLLRIARLLFWLKDWLSKWRSVVE